MILDFPTPNKTKKDQANYWLYWIVALLTIAAIIKADNSAIDIPIHDTYYVLEIRMILFLFSLVYFLFGLGNYLVLYFNRKLKYSLSMIHCFGTVLVLLLLTWKYLYVVMFSRMYYSFGTSSKADLYYALVAIALQSVYLVNILIAILNKKKTINN